VDSIDLLKNKTQLEQAARGVVEWIEKEREIRERLKGGKEEKREGCSVLSVLFVFPCSLIFFNLQREHRRKANAERDCEERELKNKEAEFEKIKQRIAER